MHHMHQVEGANPPALTNSCPCGVVQPTCLPLMQEITGAKPVRDANSGLERWSNGLLDCAQQCEGFHSLIQYSANPSLQFCPARGSRGIADPPDLGSGSLGRASRLAPTIFKAPKALSGMHSPGTRVLARCNSGWGAP